MHRTAFGRGPENIYTCSVLLRGFPPAFGTGEERKEFMVSKAGMVCSCASLGLLQTGAGACLSLVTSIFKDTTVSIILS